MSFLEDKSSPSALTIVDTSSCPNLDLIGSSLTTLWSQCRLEDLPSLKGGAANEELPPDMSQRDDGKRKAQSQIQIAPARKTPPRVPKSSA